MPWEPTVLLSTTSTLAETVKQVQEQKVSKKYNYWKIKIKIFDNFDIFFNNNFISFLFSIIKAPPKGLPGSSEALETDANGKRKTSGRGGTAEQRREKLDHAIMAANPFNSDRLIRMYVSKIKY